MEKAFSLKKRINHIAFIMDGNGRWAKLRGLPRHLGHKEACKRIREIFDACIEFGIKYISCFAFSTENWNRPEDEINHLFDYLEEFFAKELQHIIDCKGKIVISGDITPIRESTRKACLEAMEKTKDNDGYILNVCLNYGGRDEIVKAAKEIARLYKEGKVSIDEIDESNFKRYLYQPEMPDIDLLIRTSGEMRISNFMLYELSYAELVFTEVKWPDFHREELIDCLREYESRNRRYGGLKNE